MKISKLAKEKLKTDKELKRVEIFVLHHSGIEPTKRCIWSLIKNTSWPYKINIFSTDVYPKGLLAKIYNKLIKESTCEYISFVCSDAEVDSGWLDEIMKNYTDNIGCAVPLVYPAINPEVDLRPNSGIHKLNSNNMSMSISIFKKSNLLSVGCFNEAFYLYGHDVDLLRKLENKGLDLIMNTNSTAYHGVGTTTKRLFTKEEIELIDKYNKSIA